MAATPTDLYFRAVQRKNGKIIIRAMLELEKVTFESIVQKICEEYNIFIHKVLVENAVRNFLRHGYYLGFFDVTRDESFLLSAAILETFRNTEKVFDFANCSKDNNTSCNPNKRQKK